MVGYWQHESDDSCCCAQVGQQYYSCINRHDLVAHVPPFQPLSRPATPSCHPLSEALQTHGHDLAPLHSPDAGYPTPLVSSWFLVWCSSSGWLWQSSCLALNHCAWLLVKASQTLGARWRARTFTTSCVNETLCVHELPSHAGYSCSC